MLKGAYCTSNCSLFYTNIYATLRRGTNCPHNSICGMVTIMNRPLCYVDYSYVVYMRYPSMRSSCVRSGYSCLGGVCSVCV